MQRRTPLLPRRSLLAGAAAVPFWGALGRSLAAEATGALPRRFILYVDRHGWESRHRPTNAPAHRDTLVSAPLTAETLPPALAPLSPWVSRLSILDRFYCPFAKYLHGNGQATTQVMPPADPNFDKASGAGLKAGGVSLDRRVAQAIGKEDPFPWVGLGVPFAGTSSADGVNQSVGVDQDPAVAFTRLFGDRTVSQAEAAARLARRRSVLDFVASETRTMTAQVTRAQRPKVDQYLTSLRDLELQLGKLQVAAGACGTTPAPPAGVAPKATLRGNIIPELADMQSQVAFHALACGLTRVVAMSFMTERNKYGFLSIDKDKHDLSHNMEPMLDPRRLEQVDAWQAGRLAGLLKVLESTPEGGGTMLDGTLIAWVNTGGGPHHNGYNKHAVVLIGGARGHFSTGRYLGYPVQGKAGDGVRCLSDVYVSILNALGIPDQTFGDPAHNKGPLLELRA